MNTKILVSLALLAGAPWIAQAQNVGTAGSGTTATGGSIRSTTADTGAAASGTASGETGIIVHGAPSTQSAAGANVGALPPPGTADMSPTLPSRSTIDRAGQTGPDTPSGPTTQPQGISVSPPRPGISSMSGLPLSDLPTFSRGTEPIGPQPSGAAAESTRQAVAGQQPVAGASQPDANTQIGMGRTTVVPTPPPAAHVEVPSPTATDAAGQVWVPGHYSWVGGEWAWMEGGWQHPPSPAAAWVNGTYDSQNHRWTEGHWDTSGSANARDRNSASTAVQATPAR